MNAQKDSISWQRVPWDSLYIDWIVLVFYIWQNETVVIWEIDMKEIVTGGIAHVYRL